MSTLVGEVVLSALKEIYDQCEKAKETSQSFAILRKHLDGSLKQFIKKAKSNLMINHQQRNLLSDYNIVLNQIIEKTKGYNDLSFFHKVYSRSDAELELKDLTTQLKTVESELFISFAIIQAETTNDILQLLGNAAANDTEIMQSVKELDRKISEHIRYLITLPLFTWLLLI